MGPHSRTRPCDPSMCATWQTGLLRVSAEIEAAGMDVSKHGGSAYETAAA